MELISRSERRSLTNSDSLIVLPLILMEDNSHSKTKQGSWEKN